MKRGACKVWRERRQWIAFIVVISLSVPDASGQIRYSIFEELEEGTVVGNIAKDLGISPNGLKERGFRIVSGATEPPFRVNQNDGIMYVNRQIDREEVCERSSGCSINIKIGLDSPLEIHYVAVEVLDVNDNFPRFPDQEFKLQISESTLPGARFQLQAARDPDGGVNSVQQYKLSSNDHFRLEFKDRGKDGKTPILHLQKSLDREATSSFRLQMIALDGAKLPKSGIVEILIDVVDVNDNMPVFTKDIYSAIVDENSPVDTTVIQVNATDLDDGSNGEVTYSFGRNVKSKIRQLFEVNKYTGEIIVRGQLDFELEESYDIDIYASDNGNVPFSTEKSVIVKLRDLNDNAPEIEVASLSSVISEDCRPGTTVALVSISDSDSGVNGKIIGFVSDDIPFTLTPTLQDNIFSVVTKSLLDREKQSEYDVTIVAKDTGHPALSSTTSFKIEISDVNDNSPSFSVSPYTFYLIENNTPGTFLFAVRAFDLDDNENSFVKYHIPRDGGEDSELTSFININTENGAIMALKSFDFEKIKQFKFRVVGSDSGTPSLSTNVTVNVFILDQNDNAPVILFPGRKNDSYEGVVEVSHNVIAGHLVTKVRAYDADIGYNGWLLFSLLEVTDHSLFGLDRYTGQIRTLRPFTETDEAEHKLVILVKDNGNVSLSATATVIIKVVEPEEVFAASDEQRSFKDIEDNDLTFYLMITLGSVSLLFLISIVVLVVMQCSNANHFSPKYLQDTNYDGTLCHSIQYRSGEKRYMLVGPRMSIGSSTGQASHGNTLMVSDQRSLAAGEVRNPLDVA